jgi:pyruvate/2-oxoglutarate dehydrogenase complex dihydrolipoamide acyltransferase (E2) component
MFGTNMEAATIARWHKQPGDHFLKGEVLYEVESEKVTADVEAPCDGTLLEVLIADGQEAAVAAPVCRIDTN